MTRNLFFVLLFFLLCRPLFGKGPKEEEHIEKIVYLKEMFGHVHLNPNPYSLSLSTVACGHPIKVMKKKDKVVYNQKWLFSQVGPYKGYVLRNQVSDSKTYGQCFQNRYPRFFSHMNLEVSDFYYWGRLYDLFSRNRTKAP